MPFEETGGCAVMGTCIGCHKSSEREVGWASLWAVGFLDEVTPELSLKG